MIFKNKVVYLLLILLISVLLTGCSNSIEGNITIYTIGDSTVKKGRGDGAKGLWGWGDPLIQYFDTIRVRVENHAMGGTSSRSYRNNGLWDSVLEKLQPGDYVLMQFGHNDTAPLIDSIRACGTISGIDTESKEVDNPVTGKREIVHTYGWYLCQFIQETKAKGAIPVVMSPIPRNVWENGVVPRNSESYDKWAKEVAKDEGAFFIDLNEKMALEMEQQGEQKVTNVLFFDWDNTHTSAKGAVIAAACIAGGLRELKNCKLKSYLLDNPKINFPE